MKWVFIVFFVYCISLFFRAERISGAVVERFVAGFLPSNIVFHCKSASFGFRHGLYFRALKIYDTLRHDPVSPVFAADSVSIAFFERYVKVVKARMPRLHDSYYEPGPYAEPLGDREIDFKLPSLPEFTLDLDRPSILGVEPERVTAQVFSRADRLKLMGIHIDWSGRDRDLALNGMCRVDLAKRRVFGKVHGLATQSQIRPLLVALDLPTVLQYMDAFTGVTVPVQASCAWNVNLVDNDLRLDLDLHPTLGAYNGVPMSQADGKISVHTSFPLRNGVRCMDYTVTIGPLVAYDNKDRSLSGQVVINGTGGSGGEDDVVYLDFDATSELLKDDLLGIVDCLNDGALDCLKCETPPVLRLRGTLATDAAHQHNNNILGAVTLKKGSFLGVNLADATTGFAYVGDKVTFFDASAQGRDGGVIAGMAQLSFPDMDPERATFSVDVVYGGGNIGELADILQMDVGDRNGDVECEMRLSGPLSTNFTERLSGNGHIKVTNGHLAQLKLFMGLTELLAKEVPGVEKVVNQSEASATFLIEDGVVRSRDILIEGSLFSISARGEYDIPRDMLDFTVRVEIMRKDSVLGKYLIRPILWPFTKLLLEFKVIGPLDDPKWTYISVLDRII